MEHPSELIYIKSSSSGAFHKKAVPIFGALPSELTKILGSGGDMRQLKVLRNSSVTPGSRR